jgi:hypothetical protein
MPAGEPGIHSEFVAGTGLARFMLGASWENFPNERKGRN